MCCFKMLYLLKIFLCLSYDDINYARSDKETEEWKTK